MGDFKFCYNCGQKLPKIAKFCINCGANQNLIKEEQTQTHQTTNVVNQSTQIDEVSLETINVVEDEVISIKRPAKRVKSISIFNIISKSILLLLSLLMIIFTFLPNCVAQYQDESILEINSYQSIVLLFDSFQEKDIKEINESKLKEELMELYEEIDSDVDDLGDLTIREKRVLRKISYLALRLTYQSEEAHTTLDLIIFSITSLLYILFAIGFFVVSLLNFLGLFISKFEKLNSANIVMLSIIPSITLFIYFTNRGFFSDLLIAKMSTSLSLLLIFSSIIIAYYFVVSLIRKVNNLSIKEIVYSTIKMVLVGVSICLLFGPFTNSHVKTEFDGSTKKREAIITNDVFSFFNFEYSDDQLEVFEVLFEKTNEEKKAYIHDLLENFSNIKYTEANEFTGKTTNAFILLQLYSINAAYNYEFIFIIIPVLCLVALGLLCFILQQILLKFITGNSNRLLINLSSIIQSILIITAFVFTIVTLVMLHDYAVDQYSIKGYELKISANLIILLIFSLGLIFIPMNFKKKDNDFLIS